MKKKLKQKLEEPGYWISNNDIVLLLGGDENNFTPEGEKLNTFEKEYYDNVISQNKKT